MSRGNGRRLLGGLRPSLTRHCVASWGSTRGWRLAGAVRGEWDGYRQVGKEAHAGAPPLTMLLICPGPSRGNGGIMDGGRPGSAY